MAWIPVLLCAAMLGTSLQAGAQNAVGSPEDLIRALYQAHQPWNSKEIALGSRTELSRYFDEKLTALFLKDDECKRKSGLCNLDFDPFLNAQDYEDHPQMNLRIKQSSPEPNVSYEVTFRNIAERTLVYFVHKTEAGWRISDIAYPGGLSLVKILSGPQRERELSYPGWIDFCQGSVTGAPQADGKPGAHIVWQAYYSSDPRSKVTGYFLELLGEEKHTKDSQCDRWSLFRDSREQSLDVCTPEMEGPWTTCKPAPPPGATIILRSSIARP